MAEEEKDEKVETTEETAEKPDAPETVEVVEPTTGNDEMSKFMLDVLGQIANLTQKIDKLVPIEPAAETPSEEPAEEPPAEDEPSEDEVKAIDQLLQSE